MNKNPVSEGEKVAGKSILYLFAVAILKLVVGLFSGLTVLVADAVSTFSDALTIFGAYIGLKLSTKSSNSHFEFGYHKIETLAAFLISLSMVASGILLVKSGIEIFNQPPTGKYQIFAFIAVLLGLIGSYGVAIKLISVGKKANSIALVDSGKGKIVDTFASCAVLISIVANYYSVPYVEGVVTLSIAILVLKVGVTSTKESLFFLLDYWDDPQLYKQIKSILSADSATILGIDRLQLRRSGTYIFGQAVVRISPYSDLQELRSKLASLQQKIKESNPYIHDFIIFTHITKPKSFKVALPVKSGTTLKAQLASNMEETTGYLFVQLTDKRIKKFRYQSLPKDQRTLFVLTDILLKEKINILVDNDINSLLYINLRRNHHISIYPNFSDVKSAEKLLQFILIDT